MYDNVIQIDKFHLHYSTIIIKQYDNLKIYKINGPDHIQIYRNNRIS